MEISAERSTFEERRRDGRKQRVWLVKEEAGGLTGTRLTVARMENGPACQIRSIPSPPAPLFHLRFHRPGQNVYPDQAAQVSFDSEISQLAHLIAIMDSTSQGHSRNLSRGKNGPWSQPRIERADCGS